MLSLDSTGMKKNCTPYYIYTNAKSQCVSVELNFAYVYRSWISRKKKTEYYDSYGIDSPSHWSTLQYEILLSIILCPM